MCVIPFSKLTDFFIYNVSFGPHSKNANIIIALFNPNPLVSHPSMTEVRYLERIVFPRLGALST